MTETELVKSYPGLGDLGFKLPPHAEHALIVLQHERRVTNEKLESWQSGEDKDLVSPATLKRLIKGLEKQVRLIDKYIAECQRVVDLVNLRMQRTHIPFAADTLELRDLYFSLLSEKQSEDGIVNKMFVTYRIYEIEAKHDELGEGLDSQSFESLLAQALGTRKTS